MVGCAASKRARLTSALENVDVGIVKPRNLRLLCEAVPGLSRFLRPRCAECGFYLFAVAVPSLMGMTLTSAPISSTILS